MSSKPDPKTLKKILGKLGDEIGKRNGQRYDFREVRDIALETYVSKNDPLYPEYKRAVCSHTGKSGAKAAARSKATKRCIICARELDVDMAIAERIADEVGDLIDQHQIGGLKYDRWMFIRRALTFHLIYELDNRQKFWDYFIEVAVKIS